jgi:hypothetical protein
MKSLALTEMIISAIAESREGSVKGVDAPAPAAPGCTPTYLESRHASANTR